MVTNGIGDKSVDYLHYLTTSMGIGSPQKLVTNPAVTTALLSNDKDVSSVTNALVKNLFLHFTKSVLTNQLWIEQNNLQMMNYDIHMFYLNFMTIIQKIHPNETDSELHAKYYNQFLAKLHPDVR